MNLNPWTIAWRNLKRRKLRTFLTILSIVIGVASTFAVIASVDSAKKAFPMYLKEAFGKADFSLNGTDAYFSEDVHQAVKKMKDTASIALIKENTKLHLEQEGLHAIQKRVDLSGYSNLDSPLSNFKLIDGDLTAGGAVITDRTAKVWGSEVGDTLTFDTDEGQRSIQVSAIVKYTVELMGPSSWGMAKYHPWTVAVPLPIVQEWFGLENEIQSVQVKAMNGSELGLIEQQLDVLAKSYEGVYVQPVVIDFDLQSKTMDSFFLALYIAGFLGIALSAFIIFNSLYVSMKERKNEFAALKTIGYTPEQLQSMVLFEVILLSLIGTAVGLMFGYGLAVVLKMIIFMVFGIHEAGSMELFKGISLSVLAGVLIPVLAALYPVRQAGKVSIIEVMKGAQKRRTSRRPWLGIIGTLLIASGFFIQHLLLVVPIMLGILLVFPYLFRMFVWVLKPVYSLLFGFSGEVATRNLTRNQGRTAMTSVILCMGIAMIVLMSSLNSALMQTYEKVIYSSYGGNLDIGLHHIEKEDLTLLKSTEGVADAQTYALQPAVWLHDNQKRNLPVFGIGEEWIDRFPLFVTREQGLMPSELIKQLDHDEIILDKISYGVWGGQVGESLRLTTLQGPQDFTVVAVVDTMKNSGYGAFMKDEDFRASFGLKYEKNALVIKDENTSPLELRERIFELFGERIMEMFGPEDWVSVISATYTGSFTVINGLIILSILISGIGITNTLLMNIMERIRELGMMRAVGVTKRQVVRMILLEGFGIGLAATVIGCLLGVLLIFITSGFLEINSLTYQFGVSWTILALTALFGFLISLIASFTPASRAAKTRLSEALRYE